MAALEKMYLCCVAGSWKPLENTNPKRQRITRRKVQDDRL